MDVRLQDEENLVEVIFEVQLPVAVRMKIWINPNDSEHQVILAVEDADNAMKADSLYKVGEALSHLELENLSQMALEELIAKKAKKE